MPRQKNFVFAALVIVAGCLVVAAASLMSAGYTHGSATSEVVLPRCAPDPSGGLSEWGYMEVESCFLHRSTTGCSSPEIPRGEWTLSGQVPQRDGATIRADGGTDLV